MRFQKIGMRLKNVRSKKRACGCEQGLLILVGGITRNVAVVNGCFSFSLDFNTAVIVLLYQIKRRLQNRQQLRDEFWMKNVCLIFLALTFSVCELYTCSKTIQ